jgi:hypothetical protein
MNLDPIRPYLNLIKWGAIIAVLCGAFVTGCNHGQANKQKQIDQLTGQRDAAIEANKQWVAANEESDKQLKANKQFAAEQYAEAEAAGKELAKLKKATDAKIDKLSDQLDKAMKEPECTELLTAHFCSAVPLPLQP